MICVSLIQMFKSSSSPGSQNWPLEDWWLTRNIALVSTRGSPLGMGSPAPLVSVSERTCSSRGNPCYWRRNCHSQLLSKPRRCHVGEFSQHEDHSCHPCHQRVWHRLWTAAPWEAEGLFKLRGEKGIARKGRQETNTSAEICLPLKTLLLLELSKLPEFSPYIWNVFFVLVPRLEHHRRK